MKICFLTEGEPLLGSGYKFPALIGQNHMFVPELKDADLALVKGHQHRTWVEAKKRGVPWVVIEHDILSVENPKANPARLREEKRMLKGSCGVLYVSEEQQEICERLYSPLNTLVVPLKPLREDLPAWSDWKLPGKTAVYAGSIARRYASRYRYRCLHEVFQDLIEQGWEVHVYHRPGQDATAKEYRELGCKVHGHVPYQQLLREMRQYRCGIHALTNLDNHTSTTIPNKTFDYLASGIPTYCVGDFPGAHLAVEGGWGTYDIEDLPVITDVIRQGQVLDTHLPEVERWLSEALELARGKRNLQNRRGGEGSFVYRG